MAKKYIKNNKGIVSAVTTENLQLEKPLINENYDIQIHNRNMDKIDKAIQEVVGEASTNKTNISDLQTRVENGQNYKLTNDSGRSNLLPSSTSLNTCITPGFYTIPDPLDLPEGESGWVELEVIGSADQRNTQQRLFMIISKNTYYRYGEHGVWSKWIKVAKDSSVQALQTKVNKGQNHKLTEDSGTSYLYTDSDLNELKYVNGFYRVCNCLNMPPTSHGWAYVEILVHNPLYWAVQTAIDLHDSTKRYTRHLVEGTWTQWREL